VYVGAIAVTRVAFGAHFPLDVAAGLVFGYEIGRFSAALAHSVGLLREPPASPLPALRPLREQPLEQAARG
jgi:membrane-associated phospholipid phosphatase